MTPNGWAQIVVFLFLILVITKPLGIFLARVFEREKTFLDPVLRPIERLHLQAHRRGRSGRNALDRIRGRHAAVQRRLDDPALLDRARAALAAVSIRSISQT